VSLLLFKFFKIAINILIIQNSTVTMEGDGCNCSTLVVSPIFEGLSLLARQKMVFWAFVNTTSKTSA
jgi:acid stress-induced BolA-like protein IbaG/YrbA